MQVHVIAKNVVVPPSVSEFIERRLEFAIGRFAPRVNNVVVRLDDVNGPRGGVDQRCRIDARIVPSARATATGKGISLEAAICQAADRMACAIRKDLARRRTRRVRANRRAERLTLV